MQKNLSKKGSKLKIFSLILMFSSGFAGAIFLVLVTECSLSSYLILLGLMTYDKCDVLQRPIFGGTQDNFNRYYVLIPVEILADEGFYVHSFYKTIAIVK